MRPACVLYTIRLQPCPIAAPIVRAHLTTPNPSPAPQPRAANMNCWNRPTAFGEELAPAPPVGAPCTAFAFAEPPTGAKRRMFRGRSPGRPFSRDGAAPGAATCTDA